MIAWSYHIRGSSGLRTLAAEVSQDNKETLDPVDGDDKSSTPLEDF